MNSLSSFYNGFSINTAVGNNAFSFPHRKNQSIYVAPLISGSLAELEEGNHISFSEIVEGKEVNFNGLKYFLHLNHKGTEVFIFDNHNHAFFFWAYAFHKKIIGFGEKLVHVDQHKDMRNPDHFISGNAFKNLQKVFEYTNFELNVGNFIQPAVKLGLFKKVEFIDSSLSFENDISGPLVLDIDIDIFSEDLEYINNSLKIKKIRKYIKQAKFITIATSPFFVDQKRAIEKIKQIFELC